MSVKFAYIAIILIWSTTPLTLQWSAGDTPFFAVAMRMVMGLLGCWILVLMQNVAVPFAKRYWPIYCASGLSVFLAMTFVYWSSQFLPSGWISVLFGLSPILTGLFAYFYLEERSLSMPKIVGMLLGLAGLSLVFASSISLNDTAIWGILACLFSVMVTGGSSVLIKRLNQQASLSGLQVNVGGLTVAVPLFMVTWLLSAEPLMPQMSLKALLSTVYLGIIATTLGFTLYYYLLKNIEATRVSLIALITPITALLLGSYLNNEPIVANVWLGAILICSGLVSFELQGRVSWQQLKKYRRGL